MERSSIKDLIEGCINKDEAAWAKFMNHFSGLVRWSAADRLRRWGAHFCSEDIEDIKQQVFTSIWEKERLIEIRGRNAIESWLVIVAGNFAFNYIRSKKEADSPVLESIIQDADVYSTLEGSEIKDIIRNFIDGLPPHQQTALTLNYLYGKKHREIAELLKLPINTISTIIKRAKDSLRKELKIKGLI